MTNPDRILASPLSRSETSIAALREDGRSISHGPQLKVETERMQMSEYTSKLGEYAAKNGLELPSYKYDQTQLYPARFTCNAALGDFRAQGKERSKKKEAKHEASKALWEQVQVDW
jgi:dsRNA-specific ribonuclease